MQLINWNLAKHPINWLTIFFMLLIAAIGGHYALGYFKVTPNTEQGN